MNIEYFRKSVYGLDNLYIKDSKVAGLIRVLTNKKTISLIDIEALKQLGFTFTEVLLNN